jgi:hypothetical protein
MNTNIAPGNTRQNATLFEHSQIVSRHQQSHQAEAMQAALMVRRQYSRKSKSHFSHQCLEHLKASLSSAQDVFV